MQIKFKTGDVVRVTREKIGAAGRKLPNDDISTKPTIGRIIYAHPQGCFYTVQFRDRYTTEYKQMYCESFWPEVLTKINKPNFTKPRPAKKKAWVK